MDAPEEVEGRPAQLEELRIKVLEEVVSP